MHVSILRDYTGVSIRYKSCIAIHQLFVKREIFALLVVIAMDVLKCVAMGCGEQYAVMNFGMTTMLGYFASSWDFHSMVRYPVY